MKRNIIMNNFREKYRGLILSLASKKGIRNVQVFGSMAQNEAGSDSDLNFLVELEEGQ